MRFAINVVSLSVPLWVVDDLGASGGADALAQAAGEEHFDRRAMGRHSGNEANRVREQHTQAVGAGDRSTGHLQHRSAAR